MKKLLIILAVGLSLSAYSQQVNPTGTVSNLSIVQTSICACDSVEFNFIFRENAQGTVPFNIWAKNGSQYLLIHSFDRMDISQMPTTPVGNFYNDTIYHSTMTIPCDILTKLNLNFPYFSVQFTLKDGVSEGLGVVNCTVGVEEYEMDGQEVKYYNFNGQIVQPKQGELLIKQVGKTRIKVLIQ